MTLSADKAELTVVVITQISGLEKAATAAIGCANKALGIDAPNLVDQVLSTEATSATQRQSFSDRGVRVEWWPQARGVTFDTYVKWQLVSS